MSLTPDETWSADFHNKPEPEKNPPQDSNDQPKTPVQPKQVSSSPPPSFGSEQWSASLKNPNSPTEFQTTLIIILLCALIGILGWNTFRPATKWEYKIEAVPDLNFSGSMAALGQDGWELVFARRASNSSDINVKSEFNYEMIFKRPAK